MLDFFDSLGLYVLYGGILSFSRVTFNPPLHLTLTKKRLGGVRTFHYEHLEQRNKAKKLAAPFAFITVLQVWRKEVIRRSLRESNHV